MPIILILTILLSGGTAVAAEQSLPGEILYPVKVSVNERVRGWAAVSQEAKADWDVRRTERRLEEAERLAIEDRLDDEVRTRIETNFREQAERVAERVRQFEEKNPAKAVEVGANFQTSLDTHARILENIGISLDGKVEGQINKLSVKLKAESEKNLKARIKNNNRFEAQAEADTKTAAEGKQKSARHKIDEVKEFIAKNESELSVKDNLKIRAYIESAESSYSRGEEHLMAGEYKDAFLLFQQSHDVAQIAKLLVKAKIEFETNDEQENENEGDTVSPSPSVSPSGSPSASAGDDENEDESDDESEHSIRTRVKINIGL